MAFTDGKDVGLPTVDFATASYVASTGGAVFTSGKDVSLVSVDFASGNCIAGLGGLVFTVGKDVSVPQTVSGINYVAVPYLPSVFTAGVKIADFYSRLLQPGDTGKDISFFNRKPQLFSQIINVY